jgi:hypothetical protein
MIFWPTSPKSLNILWHGLTSLVLVLVLVDYNTLPYSENSSKWPMNLFICSAIGFFGANAQKAMSGQNRA